MFSFQTFVGSRCELVVNSIHTADATQLDSCVASAVCIGFKWQYSECVEVASSLLLNSDLVGLIDVGLCDFMTE